MTLHLPWFCVICDGALGYSRTLREPDSSLKKGKRSNSPWNRLVGDLLSWWQCTEAFCNSWILICYILLWYADGPDSSCEVAQLSKPWMISTVFNVETGTHQVVDSCDGVNGISSTLKPIEWTKTFLLFQDRFARKFLKPFLTRKPSQINSSICQYLPPLVLQDNCHWSDYIFQIWLCIFYPNHTWESRKSLPKARNWNKTTTWIGLIKVATWPYLHDARVAKTHMAYSSGHQHCIVSWQSCITT